MKLPALSLLLLVSSAGPSASSVLVLDSWSDAFPANSLLPNTQQPVLFTGDYCDGAACPPGTVAHYDHWDAGVIQPGLAGILAGAIDRRFDLSSYGYQTASARIDPATHRLLVSTAEASDQYISEILVTDQEANLVALGLEAFRCDVQGTFSAAQPLFVEMSLQGPNDTVAYVNARIDTPGMLTIAFDQFIVPPGFSFEHVRNVSFSFGDCMRDEDCGITHGPMTYSLGSAALVSVPTAARPASWGSLKGLYR